MYSYQGLSPLTSCQTFQATGVSTVTASEIKARALLSCLQIEKQAAKKLSLRMKTFKNRRERKFFSNLLTLPRTPFSLRGR
jgi:hypothetical protein